MNKDFKRCMVELVEYMCNQGWSMYPLPSVKLNNNPKATDGILTPTGYYDPLNKLIVLYTANRHPKDILRSFAHEARHHHQNLTGMMNMQEVSVDDPKYAQNNKKLRTLEEDAFKESNMLFRDWADNKKYGK